MKMRIVSKLSLDKNGQSLKKKTLIYLIIFLFLQVSVTFGSGIDAMQMILNNAEDAGNTKVTLDVSAQTINGRTMVPVKFISEALGKEVKWNGDTNPQTVTIKDALTTIVMSKEKASNTFSNVVLINGKNITVDVPGQVIDGRTCVPVKFISENTGSTVDYYSDTRQVTILEPGSDGKVIVLTLGSKEARVMESTFEANLRRMATRLTSNSRTEVLNLISNLSGTSDSNLLIVDSRTGAQINNLSNSIIDENADIMTQATFATDYGTLNLNSKTLAYHTDKLYFFNNANYKQINVASPKSTEVKTIASSTDILISYTKRVTTLTNTANEKYNFSTNKWEAPALVRTEAEKKLIEAVKPYIAAGEFIDTATFTNYIEAGKNGSIRVYSTSKPNATEKALFEKFENSGTSKAEFSDGANIIGINGVDQSARFNANVVKDNDVNKQVTGGDSLYLNLKYDITTKKLITFTDSTGRVIQEYNSITNKLEGLDPFRNLCTPEQYKQKTEQVLSNNSTYKGFDLAGKYDSKIWLNDSNGKPAFCLLVGGTVGTSSDRVQYYQKAVERINQVDPTFIASMRDVKGVQVISILENPNPISAAVFYRRGLGIISFNESDGYSGKAVKDSGEKSIMNIFVIESRGLENFDYLNINNQNFVRKNAVTNNALTDKQAYALKIYELWENFPVNLKLKFDGKTEIDLKTYSEVITQYYKDTGVSDWNISVIGKGVSVSEFMTNIGIAGNGYNYYAKAVN